MRKGEKIYRLVIKFNDSTGECSGIYESCDRAYEDSDESYELNGSEYIEQYINLSDIIPEERLDLTDDIGVVGIA